MLTNKKLLSRIEEIQDEWRRVFSASAHDKQAHQAILLSKYAADPPRYKVIVNIWGKDAAYIKESHTLYEGTSSIEAVKYYNQAVFGPKEE